MKRRTVDAGDAWLWLATDADTKLVPCWHVGNRSGNAAMEFIDDLAWRLASGSFFTQITHDAPFQAFLSADAARPKAAIDGGYAVPGTAFTYAIGKLVLWSKVIDVTNGEEALKAGAFSKLSIANPAGAPYGTAAIETMKALGVYDALKSKIVQGNSIAQAFQFVDTKNAEVGFVALSELYGVTDGTRWLVPQNLYAPIRQDAVLLKKGENDEASKAFLEFLKGPAARAVIEKFGYELD